MCAKKLTFLIYVLAAFFLPGSAGVYAKQPGGKQQTGILWQIERSGLRPSYIFGTVHTDDSRVIRLPEIIRLKFRQADSFVAELMLDKFSMQQASELMFLPRGQKLEELIGTQRYQRCVELLVQYDIPRHVIERMKPWAVMVMLSMPKSRSGVVLDQRLYQEAELQGKKRYGLETNSEQVAVFESFTLQQQIIMLDDAIKDNRRLPAVFDELLHYYLQRDLTGLERISEKYMLQGDNMLAKSFKQKALLDRNYRMVRRMKPRLNEGNSFIAVGALHLPGDEGILRLLEKEGYRVTAVY